MKLFTKVHLLEALKNAGLPSTYKALLKMESDGIISRGGKDVEVLDNTDRFYTREEIKEIVLKIKAYKRNEK